ncbi:hypothetical protein ACA910_015267 [Epithemia clementina (nom. ined.)]
MSSSTSSSNDKNSKDINLNNKPDKVKVTYFNAEGTAEQVRLTLLLAGVEFEDERLSDYSAFLEYKDACPYGQVPTLTINDSLVKAQTGAMIRHIATHWTPAEINLYPTEHLYAVEEVIGLIHDLQRAFRPCIDLTLYPEARMGHAIGFCKTEEGKACLKQMREQFMTTEFPKFMTHLTDWLNQTPDRLWLATDEDQPTIADCVAVPVLRSFTTGNLDYIPTDCLTPYPDLVVYLQRFAALPQIQGRYSTGVY